MNAQIDHLSSYNTSFDLYILSYMHYWILNAKNNLMKQFKILAIWCYYKRCHPNNALKSITLLKVIQPQTMCPILWVSIVLNEKEIDQKQGKGNIYNTRCEMVEMGKGKGWHSMPFFVFWIQVHAWVALKKCLF